MAVIAGACLGFVLGLGASKVFVSPPGSFNECILANMPKALSDQGARMMAGACRRQFPED